MNPLVILSGGYGGLLARETFVTYIYIVKEVLYEVRCLNQLKT